MALIDARRFDDAMPYLDRALANYSESATDERSELHTDWGSLHYEQGDTTTAVLEWRKAIRLAPKNTIAEHNLREFEDVRFERCNTVNEMILAASHPAQVLAYLLPAQTFANEGRPKCSRTTSNLEHDAAAQARRSIAAEAADAESKGRMWRCQRG